MDRLYRRKKLKYKFDIIKKNQSLPSIKSNQELNFKCSNIEWIVFPRNYFSNAYYGFGAGQVWLDDVSCNGYENDIAECESQGWGRHDCTHGNDTGVHCGRYLFSINRAYSEKNEFFHIIYRRGLSSLIVFNCKIFKLSNNQLKQINYKT